MNRVAVLLLAAWAAGCGASPPCLPLSPECAVAEADLRVDVVGLPEGATRVQVSVRAGTVASQRATDHLGGHRTTLYFFDLPDGELAHVEAQVEGDLMPWTCVADGVQTGKGKRLTLDAAEYAPRPDAGAPDAARADASTPDAAVADAAIPDAGPGGDAAAPADAGELDAAHPDAGGDPDAATSPADAGAPDAALPPDAGEEADGGDDHGRDGGHDPRRDGGGPDRDGGPAELLLLTERIEVPEPEAMSRRLEVIGTGDISLEEDGQSLGTVPLLPEDLWTLQDLVLTPGFQGFMGQGSGPCDTEPGRHDLRVLTRSRDWSGNVQGCRDQDLAAVLLDLQQLRERYFP